MNWHASLIALVAIGSSAAALADDSRQFGAVICTSEAGARWSEKARGTLTRTKSKEALIYELKAAEHAFTWRFVTDAKGATTVISPGFLMDRFAAQPAAEESPERRQSLYADGEIREYASSSALFLVIGSKCPCATASQVEKNRLVRPLHADVEVVEDAAR